MHSFVLRFFGSLAVVVLFVSSSLIAQQAPENFHWIDFHSAKDQNVVVWVTRSLEPEKWTAIREIGAEYDAALVITTERATPQSGTDADTFTVWSASLATHQVAPLITGVNLRLLDWMLFVDGRDRELGALYDDKKGNDASTFFTAFFYDIRSHMWATRWMRGTQAVPIWSPNTTPGVTVTAIDAALAWPDGRQFLATWNHFDYGNEKDPEDFLYRYDLDSFSGLERIQLLSGKEAEAMKLRLCSGTGTIPALAHGQDSTFCQQLVKPARERKPVTTPPANNHGKSVPPGARR